MSRVDDKPGRIFCDICGSRWADEDAPRHMVAVRNICGPGDNEVVAVDSEKADVHICVYCLKWLRSITEYP